jgi:general secretion pathway protein M
MSWRLPRPSLPWRRDRAAADAPDSRQDSRLDTRVDPSMDSRLESPGTGGSSLLSRLDDSRLDSRPAGALQGRWQALAPRERLLLAIGGTVLAGGLLWSVALAPAWRTLQRVPAEIAQQERALQQMRERATEVAQYRAVPPVPTAQAQQALNAATGRLGARGKLTLQGQDRAVLACSACSGADLVTWLAELRAGARGHVTEATLTQSAPGRYDGQLVVQYGSPL